MEVARVRRNDTEQSYEYDNDAATRGSTNNATNLEYSSVGDPTLSARRSAQGLHFSKTHNPELKFNVFLLYNLPEIKIGANSKSMKMNRVRKSRNYSKFSKLKSAVTTASIVKLKRMNA